MIKVYEVNIRLLILSFIVSCAYILAPIKLNAQQLIGENKTFIYVSCPKDKINLNDTYNVALKGTELYNSQPSVDSKMPKADFSTCSVQMGKLDGFAKGYMAVRFYPDEEVRKCSINGNCTGDLMGYNLSVIVVGTTIQVEANNGGPDDIMQACFSSQGELLYKGRCK